MRAPVAGLRVQELRCDQGQRLERVEELKELVDSVHGSRAQHLLGESRPSPG